MENNIFSCLWVLILLVILQEEVMSDNICPPYLYQYQENCFVNCPFGTILNKKSATCIDKCPNKNCISFSSQGGSSNFNIYCPPEMCKPPADKCFELQCFENCPSGTYTHRTSCLRHCPADANLKYKSTCVSECPKHTPYIAKSNCVPACPKLHFRFGNICTETCPNDYKVFNGTCQKECPVGFPFTFKRKNNTFCLQKCPGDTVINNTKCDIDCPRERPLHYNQTCLIRCPEHIRYMVVAKNIDNAIVKCVSKCPQNFLYDENACVNRCTENKAKFNNSCLKICPQSHPYRHHKRKFRTYPVEVEIICTKKCPINSRITGNSCYDICPKAMFKYNETCVKRCKDHNPYHQLLFVERFHTFENGCVSHCFGQFKYALGNKCVDYCPPSLLYMNNTCVEKCSGNFPFFQKNLISTYNANGQYIYRSGCVAKCLGNMVAYRNNCINDCPRNASFLYNGICVDRCPFTHKFVDIEKRNICVSVCGKDTFSFGYSCLKDCPRNSSNILNGNCLAKCPNSHPFVDVENRNSCVSECSHLRYESMCIHKCPKSMLRYNHSCTNVCPNDRPFLDITNKECVIECPGIEYNKVCLNKCINNTYNYLNTCVDKCPVGMYANMKDNACVKNCPRFNNGTFCLEVCPHMYIVNQNCVSKCPKDASFIIKSVRVSYSYYYTKKWKWKNVQPKCVSKCPSYYFVLGNRCLPFCPKGYNFTLRQHCMKQCPATFLYTSVNVNTVIPIKILFKCVTDCPKNMVYENRMCKHQCSSTSKYVVYKKCHSKCPSERPLHFTYHDNTNSIKYICLSHCPEHSYQINSTCVLYCPSEMFGFDGNCIEQCPSSHSLNYSKITDHGLAFFCERNCPVNTFLMGKNCYDVCPNSSFQFNKTCVQQCPKSHKFQRQVIVHKNQQSTVCEQKCPKFSVLNTCVNSCPHNRSFIHNNQCIPQCPKLHPFAPKNGDRFCHNTCPNGTLSFRGKHCINICPDNFVIYNKTCLSKCPSGYNYFEVSPQGQICRDKCYNSFVLSGKECVPRCPWTTFNLQGVCQSIKQCPDKYPFEENRQQGRTCTDKCLQANVLDGKFCESGCHYGNVIYDRKCVRHCPTNSPNELHNKSALKFQYQVYCYNTCPSGYVSKSNACIPEEHCYNVGYITHNGICIPNCFSNFYVAENTKSLRRFCTPSCPSGYVLNDSKCILEENCYSLNKYILNGHCVKDCKFRYYAKDDYLKKRTLCGNKCPDNYYLDENGICINYDKCFSHGKIAFNGTCSFLCPPGYFVKTNLFFFKTCTRSCPGIHHNGTHCVQCNLSTILLNGECTLRCPVLTLKFTNILRDHECLSAAPMFILLLISLALVVGCVVLFWYVFIYSCADKRKKTLSENDDGTDKAYTFYDDEETCPLKLGSSINEASPFNCTSLKNRSSIEGVSNSDLNIITETNLAIRRGAENNGDKVVFDVNKTETRKTEEHFDIKTSKKLVLDFDTKNEVNLTEGTREFELDPVFYQVHDTTMKTLVNDNSYDSIDSITIVKSTFKEMESGKNTNKSQIHDEPNYKEEQTTKNEGLGDVQNDLWDEKSENGNFNLALFCEYGKDASEKPQAQETEN